MVTGCSGQAPAAAPKPTAGPTEVPSHPPAADFVAAVDNPWMPWVPGTRWVFRGRTDEGRERTVVTVTHRTKVVDGVPAVVVHDVVFRDGRLLEDTYDWYAQDRAGNVWYFGEDTTEYDAQGNADTGGSWEAGVDGAQAGIAMKAHPRKGPAYRQEYYPGEAEDQAEVVRHGAKASVPYGDLHGLLMTHEFTRLEPDADEHKYYARGVGVVLEVALEHTDRTELVSMTRPAG